MRLEGVAVEGPVGLCDEAGVESGVGENDPFGSCFSTFVPFLIVI